MIRSGFKIFGLLLFVLAATALLAQRRGGGGQPSQAATSLVVHGSVMLPDGVVPEQLVRVEKLCGGRLDAVTYADSKGRFSFDLGLSDAGLGRGATEAAGTVVDSATLKTCTLRASLGGYQPYSVPLEQAVKNERTAIGGIVLQPRGKQQTALLSATDADVPKNARKDYDKGLDAVAKGKVQDAIGAMEKATSGYPKFATAWLSLGILQSVQNDSAGALNSFAQAIAADDKFAPPYIESAALEAASSLWSKVVEHTSKAIALEPDAFARAYYLSAIANIRINQAADARKSIDEGLRVDADHEYPDLEYLDGFLLLNKGDKNGARKQFESYLSIAPNGTNAGNAQKLLAQTGASK